MPWKGLQSNEGEKAKASDSNTGQSGFPATGGPKQIATELTKKREEPASGEESASAFPKKHIFTTWTMFINATKLMKFVGDRVFCLFSLCSSIEY